MLRARAYGLEIARDWCAVIRSVGEANPRGASVEQRKEWLYGDIDAIYGCDVFWLIIPQKTSIGCWIELGIAANQARSVIVSGDWRSTIFSAIADRAYDTHEEALAALVAG